MPAGRAPSVGQHVWPQGPYGTLETLYVVISCETAPICGATHTKSRRSEHVAEYRHVEVLSDGEVKKNRCEVIADGYVGNVRRTVFNWFKIWEYRVL